MKKIIIFIIAILSVSGLSAQQIKRATLSSYGSKKAQTTYRTSWTSGSCPGCNVISNTTTTNGGYLRQGFQQPPDVDNITDCALPRPTSGFSITPRSSATCGTRYDFEFDAQGSTSGFIYEWNFGEGASPRTSTDPNPSSVTYASAGSKFVVLTVRKGNCRVSSTRIINVLPNEVGFSAVTSVVNVNCTGEKSGGIAVSVSGTGAQRTYRWSTGATTPSVSNLAAGRYQVTINDPNGCSLIVDTVVTEPAKTLSFTYAIQFEACTDYKDGIITVNPTGGTPPYKYLWSNQSTRNTLLNLSAGKYDVTITDSLGCSKEASFEIRTRCRELASNKIFDVITPNGDNTNDTWTVKDIDKYPNNEVLIYNRWGQLVFSAQNYQNDWDGRTDDGEELPSAAYFYVVRYNDPENKILTGSVTVLR